MRSDLALSFGMACLVTIVAGCSQAPAPVVYEGTHSRSRHAAPPQPPAAATPSVLVGAGDTVFTLARRHDTTPRAIIDLNQLRPPYGLKLGQRLRLPPPRHHIVQAGDTLYALARRFDVDMHALARANGLGPPYRILIGQTLNMPGYAGAPAQPLPVSLPTDTLEVETAPAGPRASVAAVALPAPEESAPPPLDAPAAAAPSVVAASAPAEPAPPIVGTLAATPSGFIWPVEGALLSTFGPKGNGFHNDGINIRVAHGTPVRATEGGVVAYAGNELRGYGNLVLIRHADGWVSAYAHNERLLVSRGERVGRGQVIALSGASGGVAEPQLHFELRRGRNAVDPMPLLVASN